MPLDVKIFDLVFLESKNIQIIIFSSPGPSESKLLASRRPNREPLDVKIFDLDVLGSKNIQIEDFNIQKSCPSMLKAWI